MKEVAGDEDGLEDVVFFELGFAGGLVEGEEAGGAGGEGDAGGGLGDEEVGEGKFEAVALMGCEMLAVIEGWCGVVFGGDDQFYEGAVFAGGGLEFDIEADGAGLLFEDGLAFVVEAECADGFVLVTLIHGGAGAGFGF